MKRFLKVMGYTLPSGRANWDEVQFDATVVITLATMIYLGVLYVG